MSHSCIFCRIVRGEAPADVVHQDDKVTAFRDINPRAPVHILVVPNRHIPGVSSLDAQDTELVGHMVQVAKTLAEKEGVAGSGYRLVINDGPMAGQTVFHLHLHLLGGRRMSWPPG
ncbi:MAG: histidine triad nucleotide-binding protein [Anaerolineae bacterium]